MKTRIHVNQHNIKFNRRAHSEHMRPVLTVKDYKQNRKGFEADIVDDMGPGGARRVVAKVIYRPQAPLPCGATVWIETEEEVEVR